jgi:DNA-binding transcriptional MerR regulator
MRIGELSRRTGVSVRLLRYYEEQGLLMPSRRPSGYREYGSGDAERVRRIRVLLAAGLSTAKIAYALPGICAEGNQLVPCPAWSRT